MKKEQQYRDLEVGEVIQAGDEYRDPFLGWLVVEEEEYTVNEIVGQQVDDTPEQRLMRRPINA